MDEFRRFTRQAAEGFVPWVCLFRNLSSNQPSPHKIVGKDRKVTSTTSLGTCCSLDSSALGMMSLGLEDQLHH